MPKTYEQLTAQNTAIIKSNGGGNLTKTQGLSARGHFQDIIDFINANLGGNGSGVGIFAPVADIAELKTKDTTDGGVWFDKWNIYVEAEQAWYALDRTSALTDDSTTAKGVVAPTTGAGRWVRSSNINRTFPTTSALLTFLNTRPEGEVGQVKNTYGRIVKDAGSAMSVSQSDHSHDLDKACIINDNASAVIVYDRSADTLLSITDVGFIPMSVKVNPYDNNQAAIRWRNSGFTSFKTTLVNLTTGVKTAITGAGDTYNTSMDFTSTRLILADDGKVNIVLLSNNSVTSLTPLHSIDPKFVSVSPDQAFVSFAANNVTKMGIHHFTSAVTDYVDIQSNAGVIGWSNQTLTNRQWTYAYTVGINGLTTIQVTYGTPSVYEAQDYAISQLSTINEGTFQANLMPINPLGVISGYFDDNLLWEFDLYTGYMYTYALPQFVGIAAVNPAGTLIAYKGGDNMLYVFDRSTKLVHLVGNASVLASYISWGTDNNIMLSGDGVAQDIIYFSGLSTRTNGTYMQSGGVLIRLLPVQIDKVPYGGSGGSPVDLSGLETSFANQQTELNSLQEQVSELSTSAGGLESFPIQNSLVVGDFYYKTTSTNYVLSSPATEATAKVRGLVVGTSGGNLIGRLMGSTLTGSEITALNATGLSVDTVNTSYLSNTGRPDITPPVATGYFLKACIRQGNLIDETPLEIGLETFLTVTVTATGTDAIASYLDRLTVVADSASALSRTPSLVDVEDGQKIKYINKGAGTLTVVGSFNGATNISLVTNAVAELEFADGAWWKN